MLFTSPTFLYFFLPFTLIFHWINVPRLRNFSLLICSLVFYAWGEPNYVVILLLSIVLNWAFGTLLFLDFNRKNILIAGCLANICLLTFFKYFGFLLGVFGLNKTIETYLSIDTASIHLPIGISFFTFQAISYLIDAYRGVIAPQKNIIDFGLYLSLFPQLIAGPIVRYTDIIKSLKERVFNCENLISGFTRFTIGLSKKVLIANPAGELSDQIFNSNYINLSLQSSWLGVIAYAVQIFYDFSGYSDMAIGLGQMLGFEFPENFNYPYISKSIQEFWRRWHMTLSTFFRDYVYIPLGGSRVNKTRTYLNILIVFMLTGLWHGASWNFVLWGIYHGSFLCIERLFLASLLKKFISLYSHVYALLVVGIGWVIFKIEDFQALGLYLSRLISFGRSSMPVDESLMLNRRESIIAIVVGIIFSMPVANIIEKYMKNVRPNLDFRLWKELPAAFLKNIAVSALLIFSLVKISTTAYNPFIYFRF